MSTPYTGRTIPSSTICSERNIVSTIYGIRNEVTFLMTEALDFLMTEDDDYLITDESIQIETNWNPRPII